MTLKAIAAALFGIGITFTLNAASPIKRKVTPDRPTPPRPLASFIRDVQGEWDLPESASLSAEHWQIRFSQENKRITITRNITGRGDKASKIWPGGQFGGEFKYKSDDAAIIFTYDRYDYILKPVARTLFVTKRFNKNSSKIDGFDTFLEGSATLTRAQP